MIGNWGRDRLAPWIGPINQLAGIQPLQASDGPARGSRVLHVWTGSGLAFDVLADRALDIGACRYKGIPLAWTSPLGLVHPAFYEPEGVGWLRTFGGGLFVTCGLDHFGAPFDYPEGHIGLHGRVGNLPAQTVGYRAYWDGDLYRLEVTGTVRQACLFGENLVLERCISTALGSRSIRIADTITNEGRAPQRHQITYHFNIGFPLLSADTRIRLNVAETIPHDEVSAAGLAEWDRMQSPTPGWHEQNFWHTPIADAEHTVRVEVENQPLGLGLRWSYDSTWLPYLLEWKSLAEGAYVLGIEPGNSRGVHGHGAVKRLEELPFLAPGESRHYAIEIEIVEY